MISTNNITILDSNIWIALFYEKDTLHKKAMELFKTNNNSFLVTNYIDLECISVLLQKVNHQASKKWIAFRKTPDIHYHHIGQEENQEIIELFLTLQNKHLSLIDVSLLHFAQLDYQVITFDTKLQKVINTLTAA
jgi:predicted nucleic acid-binding protein